MFSDMLKSTWVINNFLLNNFSPIQVSFFPKVIGILFENNFLLFSDISCTLASEFSLLCNSCVCAFGLLRFFDILTRSDDFFSVLASAIYALPSAISLCLRSLLFVEDDLTI